MCIHMHISGVHRKHVALVSEQCQPKHTVTLNTPGVGQCCTIVSAQHDTTTVSWYCYAVIRFVGCAQNNAMVSEQH